MLQIIGAGFGRTGTLSMKRALEMLGFDPCYHMAEVLKHPEHDSVWQAATNDQPVVWDDVFSNFAATVDWPAASFWREIRTAYPSAKVLLTVRDADAWYRSVSNTIYKALTSPRNPDSPVTEEHRVMTRMLILERVFGGKFEDRDHAIGVFNSHNEAVRAEVPADELLVYETGSGWEPLCQFFGLEVPTEPFPHTNTTAEFNQPGRWNPQRS